MKQFRPLSVRSIKRSISRSITGFSLIEMMVSLLMSGMLILILTNVVIANQNASTTQESISEIQNNGRIAVGWLNHDLRMAGNVSLTYSRAPIHETTVGALVPTITDNCFTTGTQAFDWARALLPLPTGHPAPTVYGVDNAATSNAVFSGCVDGADLQVGSDLLSLHFTESADIDDDDLADDSIYINSGLGGAVMFQ
jgi:Tfp pilus assembly protein PilW